MPFTADAVEHSKSTEAGAELQYHCAEGIHARRFDERTQARKAAEQAFGRPMQIKITVGRAAAATPLPLRPSASGVQHEDEATAARALRSGCAKLSRSRSRRAKSETFAI